MESVRSVCRFCHAGCAIVVDVEDGRAVRVRGDRDDPVYRGFTCEKGRQLPEQHAHPNRLRQSQRRRADGSYEPIASADAIAEIAERLRVIVDRYGPRAVASYTGTCASRNPLGRPSITAFMDAIGSPMRFDSNTIDQPGKAVAQAMHGVWNAPPHGFDTAAVTLLIGVNPFVSLAGGLPNPDPVRRLREARARGMKLIVIDPRHTETAQAADVFVQPRPGEDVAIVAAILHVIISEGRYDEQFVAGHVAGFDALAAAVRGFDPDTVAARAGVRPDELVTVARTFADTGRGVAVSGTGPGFAGAGSTLLEYLVMVLNTVCGRYLRAGDPVWNPGVLLPALAHKAQATSPWPAFGYGEALRVRGLRDTAAGLSAAALPDEIVQPGEGQVRALICLGGNPAAAFPDRTRTWQALRSLDLLVTLDITMSATAKAAHYVIAPTLTLEVPGSTYVSESMYHYATGFGLPVPYAHYTPAVVSPPAGADVIEEWTFFARVAQAMGRPLALRPNFARPGQQPLVLDQTPLPSTDELLEFAYQNSRVPLSAVKAAGRGTVFDATVVVEPADPGADGRLDVGNPDLLAELGDHATPRWPDDPEHPYRLVCRRTVGVLNSSGRDLPRAQERPHNPAFLHPDDLADLGLSPGDVVELVGTAGTVLAIVERDPRLRRGLVSMSHSYGGTPDEDARFAALGSNVADLTRADVDYDRITGMPHLSNIAVTVRRPDARDPRLTSR